MGVDGGNTMRTAVLTHGWRHPQGDDELLSTVSTSKRNHNRFLVLRSQSSHRLARVRAISLCLFLGGAGIRFVPSSSGQLELRETCGGRPVAAAAPLVLVSVLASLLEFKCAATAQIRHVAVGVAVQNSREIMRNSREISELHVAASDYSGSLWTLGSQRLARSSLGALAPAGCWAFSCRLLDFSTGQV